MPSETAIPMVLVPRSSPRILPVGGIRSSGLFSVTQGSLLGHVVSYRLPRRLWRWDDPMKLTWFGSDTFRIHAAGAMVVVSGAGELPGVDRAELVSGADLVVDFDQDTNAIPDWKPRPPLKMLEADE